MLLALGSTYRRLGIPGEDDLIGAGVHFCATCDGAFYRDREGIVIGGGNSAGEESLFLTRFALHVTIITRDAAMSASRVVVTKLEEHADITILTGAEPTAFATDDAGKMRGLVVTRDGASQEVAADGAFVFIGLSLNTAVVEGLVAVDGGEFITDTAMQSSVPGVFVAGDVRAGSTKQAASAAGEGAAAALMIRRYVEPLSSGLPPRGVRPTALVSA